VCVCVCVCARARVHASANASERAWAHVHARVRASVVARVCMCAYMCVTGCPHAVCMCMSMRLWVSMYVFVCDRCIQHTHYALVHAHAIHVQLAFVQVHEQVPKAFSYSHEREE